MIDLVYAMGAPAGQSQGGGGGLFAAFLPLIIIMVIFYFLLIRPQKKQQKKHQDMLGALKKGDKVLTSGGIYGTIVGINEKDNIVVLRIDENVKVEVGRGYIATLKGHENEIEKK